MTISETTLCQHSESMVRVGGGFEHGTCKFCGQIRRYDTRNEGAPPTIIKLGRIHGVLVLPKKREGLALPTQEEAELKKAQKDGNIASAEEVTQEEEQAQVEEAVEETGAIAETYQIRCEGLTGRGTQCGRIASRQEDGKWYCAFHPKASRRAFSSPSPEPEPEQTKESIAEVPPRKLRGPYKARKGKEPKKSEKVSPEDKVTDLERSQKLQEIITFARSVDARLAALEERTRCPEFPEFDSSWMACVQEKWLETYLDLRRLELGDKFIKGG